MKASIIICTYNRLPYLKKAIDAVLKQDSPDWELIVVDNNCSDGTAEYVMRLAKEHERIRYIKETNQGLSHSRNRGAAEAQYEILLYLDDDAWVVPGLVREYIKTFEENSEVGCVGGRVLLDGIEKLPYWFCPKLWGLLGEFDMGEGEDYRILNKRSGFIGANFAMLKKAFEKTSGFDILVGRTKGVLLSDEDIIMCYHIFDLGYKLAYNPMALAYHTIVPAKVSFSYVMRWGRGLGISRGKKDKKIKYFAEMLYRLVKIPIDILINPRKIIYRILGIQVVYWKLRKAFNKNL